MGISFKVIGWMEFTHVRGGRGMCLKEWTARHGVLKLIYRAIDCGLEGGDACSFAIVIAVEIISIIVGLAGIKAMLFWEGVIFVAVGVDVVIIGGSGGVIVVAAMLRLLLLLLLLEETHGD
jgi:hypothetical protein